MRSARLKVRFPVFASLFVALVGFGTVAHADGWRDGAPMTTARANAGGILVGDDLYVIGGSSTSGPRAVTEVYDTRGDIWRAAAPLSVGLEQFGIATDGESIFVSGGLSSQGSDQSQIMESRDFWIFDVKTGTWTAAPHMPTARYGHALAYVGGKVYALGGRGADASRIYVYDLGSQSWTVSKASNPAPRSDSAVVTVGDLIYVIGGVDKNGPSARVDIFNPAQGTWTSGPALPLPRDGLVAAVLDNKIHVSGGQNISPPKTYSDHFVFDLNSKSWSRAAPLPTPTHGAVAAATRGKFFVVGGAPGAGVYTVFTSSDLVNIYSAQ